MGYVMRILLFHESIDPLNHFTDMAKSYLDGVGCETHVCSLPLTERETFSLECFLQKGVHAVIMYDGIGMCFKEIYDLLNIPVVNILVDHPMTFGHCMAEPPGKYIQFSPDENHVRFGRKYWNIRNSFFLPHMGTAPFVGAEDARPLGLLFAGSAWSFEKLTEDIRGSAYSDFFVEMIEYMLLNPSVTIEKACNIVAKDRGISLSDEAIACLLEQAKAVDEYVRMYYRDRIMRIILDAGMDITVIGDSWDQTDFPGRPNFHWIGELPFCEVFPYMSRSRAVLNVMPWFKSGSHERVFNSLLSGACPISDHSAWLDQKFEDRRDIVFYDLNELERLPGIIGEVLENEDLRRSIVRRGQEKVLCDYRPENVVGEVLQILLKFIT